MGGHNPDAGFEVDYIPFDHGKPGAAEDFADGFAGGIKDAAKAAYRPVGEAMGPDGSLYIGDSQKGPHLAHLLRRPSGTYRRSGC